MFRVAVLFMSTSFCLNAGIKSRIEQAQQQAQSQIQQGISQVQAQVESQVQQGKSQIESLKQELESKFNELKKKLDPLKNTECSAICLIGTEGGYAFEELSTQAIDPRVAYELLINRCILLNTLSRTAMSNSGKLIWGIDIPKNYWLFQKPGNGEKKPALDKNKQSIQTTFENSCHTIEFERTETATATK